jgi:hypothetical protein
MRNACRLSHARGLASSPFAHHYSAAKDLSPRKVKLRYAGTETPLFRGETGCRPAAVQGRSLSVSEYVGAFIAAGEGHKNDSCAARRDCSRRVPRELQTNQRAAESSTTGEPETLALPPQNPYGFTGCSTCLARR